MLKVVSGFLIVIAAHAQLFSFGVTGAVPISPHTTDGLHMQPYAVGPNVDLRLPWRVSIEAGVLYERLNQNLSSGLNLARGGDVNFGYTAHTAANAWLFSLLVKRSFGHRSFAPFADVGATLRHLGDFEGRGLQLDFYLQPHPSTFRFPATKDLDVAVTAGMGLTYRLSAFGFAPEIRYLHWTSTNQQPAQNQAMLMLGIQFHAHR